METNLNQYFYILEIEISVEINIATQEFRLKLMSNTAKQEFRLKFMSRTLRNKNLEQNNQFRI